MMALPPIHDAAWKSNLEEVMRFVQDDPGMVHTVDDEGGTALHYASYLGHVEVASYLLDQGADISMSPIKMARLLCLMHAEALL